MKTETRNETAKNTPGPLRVQHSTNGFQIAAGGNDAYDSLVVATTPDKSDTSQANANLFALAPETAAERDRLREALRQIQNNAAARKWNSESVDRADLDAWTTIETKAMAALAGLPDPDPAQRVRDAAPDLLEALQRIERTDMSTVGPEWLGNFCRAAIARATGGERHDEGEPKCVTNYRK